MSNVVETLRARGLFEAATSETIDEVVATPQTVYAGFDPTSSSLQVGNLVAIMGLAHFQRAGHKVIALVGGATGMIGDPSGKSDERTLLTEEAVAENVIGIRENLERFLDFDHTTAPAAIVNNNDWFATYGFVPFLRDIGKHFRMGSMLSKESVKSRLGSEAGMSFTEFSYQLLQGYDFLHLLDEHGCTMQLGGSDQWGNITAGTDLIRKLRGADAYGLTLPLVCDSTGQKFGKSAGNAVYLSEAKTSCYDFYQFFVRTEDADVVAGFEQCLGVTAAAEGRVQHDPTRSRRDGVDDLLTHHGRVFEVRIAHASSSASSFAHTRGGCTTASSLRIVPYRDGRHTSSLLSAPARIAWAPARMPAWSRLASSSVIRPCLSIDATDELTPKSRRADSGSSPLRTSSIRVAASASKFPTVVIAMKPPGSVVT